MKDNPVKLRAKEKLARIPIKIAPTTNPLPKPPWLRVKLPSDNSISKLKSMLSDKKLVTVCEEASCPNLPECFGNGTATFMIMGDICTRRCSFCDVGYGKPQALNAKEPLALAEAVSSMGLAYVVITSVDRDDLADGGASHFVACIQQVQSLNPTTKIEVLVPDFRGKMDKALAAFASTSVDVFNHNIETVPRLYKQARLGANYQWSLTLLQQYQQRFPKTPTKSGLMLGLGETKEEVVQVLKDLREHEVTMVTIGQYLAPSKYHLPVARYVPPSEFAALAKISKDMGFSHVASGPMVRSSYHADKQASGSLVVS